MPARFTAAVDLGATNVRVAIVDEDGEIQARRAAPLPHGPPADVIEKIGRTIDDLVRGVWVGAKVAAISVVLPGAVDPERGTVVSVANMPGWDDVHIADMLGKPREIPVVMENDANAAAIGEGWMGAARGLRDYVFIALGTGIGGGVVIDGRLHRGAHLLGGEIAFFRMTREQAREADWERNCLEAMVSGRAASAKADELLGAGAKASELFDAARSGDARAAAWLIEVREYLAMAVCDIVAVLDPEAVIFGGGVVAAQGDALLGPVRELVHRAMPVAIKIEQSQLGEDAQIVGAVKLALDSLDAERPS